MRETIEALDFFRANNCEVTIWDTTFDIWSNVSKRYILQNANEIQLINFYKTFKSE